MAVQILRNKIVDILGDDTRMFKTGSRTYGGYTVDSDHDYVVLKEDMYIKEIIFKLKEHYHLQELDDYAECNFHSLKFRIRENTVNLLIVSQKKYYDDWLFATDMMCKLPDPIKNKKLRVETFEKFKEISNLIRMDK